MCVACGCEVEDPEAAERSEDTEAKEETSEDIEAASALN